MRFSQWIDDPKLWYDRAAEIRVMADEMNNNSTRRMMYALAEDYNKLGDRASERQSRPAGSTDGNP